MFPSLLHGKYNIWFNHIPQIPECQLATLDDLISTLADTPGVFMGLIPHGVRPSDQASAGIQAVRYPGPTYPTAYLFPTGSILVVWLSILVTGVIR